MSSDTTQVYDPSQNRWYPLASRLSAPRWNLGLGRSLVEMRDGRFMVAGGIDNPTDQNSLPNVDVFDPGACAWRPAGSMNLKRSSAAIGVPVPDGNPLICGGWIVRSNQAATDTCERYEPALDRWIPGPVMSKPRAVPANAAYKTNVSPIEDPACSVDRSCQERLPNGNILVASGIVTGQPLFPPDPSSEECNANACTNLRPTWPARPNSTGGGTGFSQAARINAGPLSDSVMLCGGFNARAPETSHGCMLYHSLRGWSASPPEPAGGPTDSPHSRVFFTMLETCPAPHEDPETCPGPFQDQLVAVGGRTSGSASIMRPDVDRFNSP